MTVPGLYQHHRRDRPRRRFTAWRWLCAPQTVELTHQHPRTPTTGGLNCTASNVQLMCRGHFACQPLRQRTAETYTAQSAA